MSEGLFVTGTDTGIGKTRIAAALLHALGRGGLRVAGFKPVAAGCEDTGAAQVHDDVRRLRAASSVPLDDDAVGPCRLAAACAPQVAAELEGRTIERRVLLAAARALVARCDLVVAEGVGGFRVPLGDGWDSADLATALGWPVVLVVGVRLGCLNHALLTAEAIAARGLRLAGWVGNAADPRMAYRDETLAALRVRLGAPCLGVVPWLAAPEPPAVAAHLCVDVLRTAGVPVR